jgi:neurotransmitter:Na+ symporter, NSS family
MAKEKERWGTKLGVILAVAGSAIGLGNFLRFPVQAAKNGGGSFMIPYLVALALLGIPLMWAEWTAGRFGGYHGHSSAPGIFQSLWKNNRLIKYFGIAGIFGPFLIFMYYVYIESWTLAYSYYAVTGQLSSIADSAGFVSFLSDYQGVASGGVFSGSVPAFVFFIITFAMNILVISYGIKGGIEKLCNIALPLLVFFGIALAVRVVTLFAPNSLHPDWSSINGLGFLWNPDFSALKSAKVWLAAAGQIFYTLSLGMGVILTYSSYLKKDDDIITSGLAASSANEFAEVVLGGSIVITAAFIFFGPDQIKGIADSGAFNLGFVTMPQIFNKIPLGAVFGFAWFFMLFLAGVTSSISLAQPSLAFMEDEFNFSRRKAVKIFAGATFFMCLPAVIFLHRGVLDDLDFWGGSFFIVIGATIEIIILAWVFGIDRAWDEMHVGARTRLPRIFKFIIKYITPTFLLVILGYWFYSDWWKVITMADVPTANVPYVLGIRIVLLLIFVSLGIFVWMAWRKNKTMKNN